MSAGKGGLIGGLIGSTLGIPLLGAAAGAAFGNQDECTQQKILDPAGIAKEATWGITHNFKHKVKIRNLSWTPLRNYGDTLTSFFAQSILDSIGSDSNYITDYEKKSLNYRYMHSKQYIDLFGLDNSSMTLTSIIDRSGLRSQVNAVDTDQVTIHRNSFISTLKTKFEDFTGGEFFDEGVFAIPSRRESTIEVLFNGTSTYTEIFPNCHEFYSYSLLDPTEPLLHSSNTPVFSHNDEHTTSSPDNGFYVVFTKAPYLAFVNILYTNNTPPFTFTGFSNNQLTYLNQGTEIAFTFVKTTSLVPSVGDKFYLIHHYTDGGSNTLEVKVGYTKTEFGSLGYFGELQEDLFHSITGSVDYTPAPNQSFRLNLGVFSPTDSKTSSFPVGTPEYVEDIGKYRYDLVTGKLTHLDRTNVDIDISILQAQISSKSNESHLVITYGSDPTEYSVITTYVRVTHINGSYTDVELDISPFVKTVSKRLYPATTLIKDHQLIPQKDLMHKKFKHDYLVDSDLDRIDPLDKDTAPVGDGSRTLFREAFYKSGKDIDWAGVAVLLPTDPFYHHKYSGFAYYRVFEAYFSEFDELHKEAVYNDYTEYATHISYVFDDVRHTPFVAIKTKLHKGTIYTHKNPDPSSTTKLRDCIWFNDNTLLRQVEDNVYIEVVTAITERQQWYYKNDSEWRVWFDCKFQNGSENVDLTENNRYETYIDRFGNPQQRLRPRTYLRPSTHLPVPLDAFRVMPMKYLEWAMDTCLMAGTFINSEKTPSYHSNDWTSTVLEVVRVVVTVFSVIIPALQGVSQALNVAVNVGVNVTVQFVIREVMKQLAKVLYKDKVQRQAFTEIGSALTSFFVGWFRGGGQFNWGVTFNFLQAACNVVSQVENVKTKTLADKQKNETEKSRDIEQRQQNNTPARGKIITQDSIITGANLVSPISQFYHQALGSPMYQGYGIIYENKSNVYQRKVGITCFN